MKESLCLFVKNPFTQRDHERMGVAELGPHFDLRIFDCSPWLMPQASRMRSASAMQLPNLQTVSSYLELKTLLKDLSGGIAIDYVGQFSLRAVLLLHHLKKRQFKLIVMDSGAHAFPAERNLTGLSIRKWIYAIKNRYLQRGLNAVIRKLFLRLLPDQSPDFAFVSGTAWMSDARFTRAKVKIPAHSFDYEKYLQIRNLPPFRAGEYAVYLDENIAGHEDNAELGYPRPVSAAGFFPALADLFSAVETASGLPVIVAGYPSDQHGPNSSAFGKREVVYGETANLIRGAKLVFAHASTAISFAVLWRRPLVFLTSRELTSSWYFPWIAAPRSILNAPLVDIDSFEAAPKLVAAWQDFDRVAYDSYRDTFIKSAGSPECSLWDILVVATQNPSPPGRSVNA
jgi:hypothetical protein